MPDPMRVVDDIRAMCTAVDQQFQPRMKELAVEYAALCAEANARLRRCEEFLQKGLRTEAIQLAETEPALLDVVGTLDFAERADWDRLAATYGLTSAPLLALDTAEAINRAYADAAPLEQLMRQLRRLALARSTLFQRIATARQIAQLDIGNPVWEGDIRALEEARLREMQPLAEKAIARDDRRQVTAFWNELTSEPWRTPVPVALQRGLLSLRINQIAVELQDAMQRQQLSAAVRARDEWQRLAGLAGLAPDEALSRKVAPALRWIETQEQKSIREMEFANSIATLEAAIKAEEPPDRLRELYADAQRYRLAVPRHIEELLFERLDSVKRQRSSAERIVLALCFVVGAMLLTGLLLFLVLRQSFSGGEATP